MGVLDGIRTLERGGAGLQQRLEVREGRTCTTFAVSRDGSTLVFSRRGIDADLWRLDLAHPAASRAIAQSTMWDGGAEYSPDGQRIAFSSNRGGSREIWVADGSGEHAQALTHFGGPISGTARWSPDGRELAFDSRPAHRRSRDDDSRQKGWR